MTQDEKIIMEYFSDKLIKLQDEYNKLYNSYAGMIDAYEKLSQDYECCALDLKVTQQELDDANRDRYRNQHGSYSYPFGENN